VVDLDVAAGDLDRALDDARLRWLRYVNEIAA
jgi:hypothetical protein